ncbi:alpha/beta hydrolase [Aphanothece sacrum]|nr:alpha/beta hydrolase [Aphanothece sacrum]
MRFLSLIIATFFTVLTAFPILAAEQVYLIYGGLNLSVRISSLEKFAQTGIVDKNLEFYFNIGGLNESEKNKFREALFQPHKINPVQLSRFLKTQIGEEILTNFGKFMKIQGGRNGKYALRGALVQAAFEPEGLTLINVLRKLPTNLQIDLEQTFALSDAIKIVVKATQLFSVEIAQLSTIEAKKEKPVNFSNLRDLRQPGTLGIAPKKRWLLTDKNRNRRFYVDLYKPKKWRQEKTPVIIMSHGLASRPEDFYKHAEYLTSYGYVVVIPQHPGSDYQKIQDLLGGYTGEIFDINEFKDRPQDISYVIDELERRNQTEFKGKLDLKNVGVLGHSLGGYTALALAGATLHFENLERECNKKFSYLNLSLLLQCRALKLEKKSYNFRDERVKAIFAANPVNSSIFGSQGLSQIKIPVFIGAGNYDAATPAIFEQIRSFPWLRTPDKYLLLVEGQAHLDFSNLDAGMTNIIESISNLTLPNPELLYQYSNALMLAFFENYISKNSDYRPYLQASYTTYLSQKEPFKAYLISQYSSEALSQLIQKFIAENYSIQP